MQATALQNADDKLSVALLYASHPVYIFCLIDTVYITRTVAEGIER